MKRGHYNHIISPKQPTRNQPHQHTTGLKQPPLQPQRTTARTPAARRSRRPFPAKKRGRSPPSPFCPPPLPFFHSLHATPGGKPPKRERRRAGRRGFKREDTGVILKEGRAREGPTMTSPCGGSGHAAVRGGACRAVGRRDGGTRPARWDHGVCRPCRGKRKDEIAPGEEWLFLGPRCGKTGAGLVYHRDSGGWCVGRGERQESGEWTR